MLVVGVACFFCLATLGPALMKDSMREGNPLHIAGVVFGFLFGVVAMMWLVCSALDKAEEPEMQELQKWGEEQHIEALERENATLRQWAKSGKMPVKLSSKGDSER